MRRGEIVGLKWSDLSLAHSRLSVSRTLQNVGGRPVEFAPKTRTSRRSVEIDRATLDELRRWRRQLGRDGLPCGPDN
jgi:integrase